MGRGIGEGWVWGVESSSRYSAATPKKKENKGLFGAAAPCLACKLTSVLRATIQTPLSGFYNKLNGSSWDGNGELKEKNKKNKMLLGRKRCSEQVQKSGCKRVRSMRKEAKYSRSAHRKLLADRDTYSVLQAFLRQLLRGQPAFVIYLSVLSAAQCLLPDRLWW